MMVMFRPLTQFTSTVTWAAVSFNLTCWNHTTVENSLHFGCYSALNTVKFRVSFIRIEAGGTQVGLVCISTFYLIPTGLFWQGFNHSIMPSRPDVCKQPSAMHSRGFTGAAIALILHGSFVDHKVNQKHGRHMASPLRCHYKSYLVAGAIFIVIITYVATMCTPQHDQIFH